MDIRGLFLENRGVKQVIFKNTFWLGVATVVSKILNLVLLIYVARILGAEEYGRFTFALAFVALFTVIHDFGLPQIIIREFSRKDTNKKEFYSVISLNILMSIVVFGVIILSTLFTGLDLGAKKAILILGVANIISNFANIFISLFQAQNKMEYRTGIEIFRSVLLLAAGLAIIFYFPSAENLSLAYLFTAVVALPFILAFFSFKLFKPKIYWEKSVWKKFLTISWPLALVGMFGIIYNYVDSIMMGFWGMMTQTGWYNAAVKIIAGATLPGVLISKSCYPLLSKFHKQKEMLQKTLNHQIELMIILALPIIAGGFVLAPRIIHAFYPSDFSPAVLALKILILGTGIFYITRPFADLMIVFNQQKKFFLITVFGALINIVLNLILIPKYSLYGAAVATVITNLAVFLVYFAYYQFFTRLPLLKLKFIPVALIASVCTFIMYFVIKQPTIYNLHIFVSIILGALVYFIGFVALKSLLRFTNLYSLYGERK
ncbi:hypothetical protein AMJ47_00465 [Parcubacteria bacterium DG_72]|nr:MAG: hypothetical protein AMJ47_00465 [Parcubacteria bacterium DG_72]